MSALVELERSGRSNGAIAPAHGRALPKLPLVPEVRTARRKPLALRIAEDVAATIAARRVFLLLPFALIAGLVVSASLPEDPSPWVLCGVAVGLLAVLAIGRHWASVLYPAQVAVAFWAGIALLPIHAAMFGTPMLSAPAYGVYQFTVDEVLTVEDGKTRAIISAITADTGSNAVTVRRARVVLALTDAAPGDVLKGEIRFYPVPAPVLPNGFDTQFHAFFDGVGAYGTSTGPVSRIGQNAAPVDRLVAGLRQGISQQIDAVLTAPSAGIARALINGDQSLIDGDTRQVLATSGLAHVYSVSGLHLSLVAVLTMAVLRVLLSLMPGLGRIVSEKRVAALGGIVAALGYYAISGGNVAALRSTIMVVLILGAVVFGRRALTLRNVAIAALLILLTDPASAFRPSFQLSFAAVVGLVGTWESWRPGERETGLWERSLRYLGASAMTSAVAGLSTVLFSVYYFQQTSPLGIVANMLALPLVSLVMMPAAMLATLLMPLNWAAPAIHVLGWSIDRMMDIARLVAGMSAGLGWSPMLTPMALMVGLAGYAWFTFFSTKLRFMGPVLAAAVIFVTCLDRPPDVLIADTTQAIAVRDGEGMGLVSGKATSFAVRAWAEELGTDIAPKAAGLTCDDQGCAVKSSRGFQMAVVKTDVGLQRACGRVELIVIRLARHVGCEKSVVIDAEALARGGSHWLRWMGPPGFEIRTAVSNLSRPWRVQPR